MNIPEYLVRDRKAVLIKLQWISKCWSLSYHIPFADVLVNHEYLVYTINHCMISIYDHFHFAWKTFLGYMGRLVMLSSILYQSLKGAKCMLYYTCKCHNYYLLALNGFDTDALSLNTYHQWQPQHLIPQFIVKVTC